MPAIYDLANRGLAPARLRARWASPAATGSDQDFEQVVHEAVKAGARCTPFR